MAFNSDIKQFFSVTDLSVYLSTLPRPTWKPKGSTYHNTYRPTEAQWRGQASMLAMRATYMEKGWTAGPHFYLALHSPRPSDNGIWQMTPPTSQGVHGVTCNPTHFGIEVVGDFQAKAPSPEQQDLLINVTAALHRWAGLGPILNAHRDCIARTCPGDAFYALKGNLQKRLSVALALPTTQTQVIGVDPSVSLAQFQTWLKKYRAPITDVDAQHVYNFANDLDIDAAFIAAIWQHETTKDGKIGGSDLFRKSNNAGAIRAYGRWPAVEHNGSLWNRYESAQLGVMALVFHMKQLYGAEGFYFVENIIPRYAPAGDGNKPAAYINAVLAAMQEMKSL